MVFKFILAVALVGLVGANSANEPAFWKGTPIDGKVEKMRSKCISEKDSDACLEYKMLKILDSALKKSNFQLTDDVAVHVNENARKEEGIGNGFIKQLIVDLENNEITLGLPSIDATVTATLDSKHTTLRFSIATSMLLKIVIYPIVGIILVKVGPLLPVCFKIFAMTTWKYLQFIPAVVFV